MGSAHQQSWLGNKNPRNSEDLFLSNCLTAREVGLWAAGLMGLEDDQATAYAHALVNDFVTPGPLDIVQKLQADFQAKGIRISEHRIALAIDQRREAARKQISLRIWSKTPGDGGWERRIFPRLTLPPMVVPPCIKEWLERHKGTSGQPLKS